MRKFIIQNGKKQVKYEFKCESCSKSYASKVGLSEHTKINHSGEKPYQCTECKKAFVLPRYLRMHKIATHTKERFKCHLCGSMYKHMTSLKKHMKAHQNEQ